MSASAARAVRLQGNGVLFSYGVSRVWAPPRGLYYSFAIHVAIFFILAFLAPLERLLFPVHVQIPPAIIAADHEVLILPNLGGGSEGSEGGHSGSGGAPQKSDPGKSGGGSLPGMVYGGPQPIISNPPKPDNLVQTIRQPDLVSPPKLSFPIPAPNLMLLAARPAMPVLEKPPVPPPPSTTGLRSKNLQHAFRPQALPPQVITIASQAPSPPEMPPPKLTLPPANISGEVAHPTATAPVLAAQPAATAANRHSAESSGQDDRNLLVINAINLRRQGRLNIPPGEASGSFTVVADSGALTRTAGVAGGAPGIGAGANGGSGGGTVGGSGGGNGGNGTGSGSGSGSGSGTGPGTGNGTGTGTGNGTGSGTGRGGTGNGPGTGTGTGTGTGPGSGVGPGNGPFRDVGIGGGGGNGTGVLGGGTAASVPSNPARQYSYGMTIVASGASGGGLRDFGVFRNEAVYTVYLAPDPHTGGPQWVLQYAAAGPMGSPQPGVVTPPYPLSRESPRFPADVVIRNAGRVIVVYGVIDASGKVEGARILQSPNPLLNQPLMDAMARWVFKPAESNGQAAAVRVLLGIPLATPLPF